MHAKQLNKQPQIKGVWKRKTKLNEHDNEPRDNETLTSQKIKCIRKTSKHPARRQKLKDAKAVSNNKETGEGKKPKHTGPKPTPQKVKLTT